MAAGKTLLAVQCTAKQVTFDTVITNCGPQPRFGTKTIGFDGWELVDVTKNDCFWARGYANFNNRPHVYRHNTWQPIMEP